MATETVSPELVVAEDDPTARELLLLLADRHGIRAAAAADGESAMNLVGSSTKTVLLDLHMPKWDGFRCLEHLADHHPNISALVLTAANQAAEAVRALRLGAVDYLTKPFDPGELFPKLFKAFELHRRKMEGGAPQGSMPDASYGQTMVADSPAMMDLMVKARKIAPLNASVLLTGESGVGKGVMARRIHSLSPRAGRPFVTVSCPALPRELLESELFGHEKGAFTGAVKRRIGRIEAAAGGTLFLDEIGELPIDLQPKLLSVLQDRQFQRVGGEATLQADVRLVSATNVDFKEKIADGSFRKDLFYRLSVIPLEIPPLRDRAEEIAPLAENILTNIARQRDTPVPILTLEAMELVQLYQWPGNVRELENVLERSSAFCDDMTITVADLPQELDPSLRLESGSEIEGVAGRSLEDIERSAILQNLRLYGGNKAETARRLGISEKSIYNKLKSYKIP